MNLAHLALLALAMGWGQQPQLTAGVDTLRADGKGRLMLSINGGEEIEIDCSRKDDKPVCRILQRAVGYVPAPETTAPELPLETCTDAPFSCITAGTNSRFPSGSSADAPKPEPIDMPAHLKTRAQIDGEANVCPRTGGIAELECMKAIRQYGCADPSRYLLGPNGKGEYICHKSQKEQQ